MKFVIDAKKVWAWPHESDVLIYDACGIETLLEYLHPWSPEVLHVRNEFINIPVLLHCLLSRSKKTDAYTDCFIKKVNPKLIVTFIDNNSRFYTISQRHPSVKTMFIQNGVRAYYDAFDPLEQLPIETRNLLTVDYMLSFGSNIGAEYKRYVKGNVVSVGSLKNNHVTKKHATKNNVVAYISQWHPNGIVINNVFQSHEIFFKSADQAIIKFLVSYVGRKNKQLVVIPRNFKGSLERASEEAYFRELAGKDVVFFEPIGTYGSYQAVDKVGVVVGVDSSLIYEAIARGTKAAIFSIRSKLIGDKSRSYGWPGIYEDDGPFWTNNLDSKSFERIMDYLFKINHHQWQALLTEHAFANVMEYDPDNKTLKSLLEKELGSLPSRTNTY